MPAQDVQPSPDMDTPLWRFALTLWQQDEARNLCLQLQQEGWSVTRLLCAGWLATQGADYSGSEPDGLKQWRSNVTEVIRSLKKSLSKSDSLAASLRNSLASAEVEAERVELYRAWLTFRDAAPDSGLTDTISVAERNLRRAGPGHSPSDKTEPMIRHLAQLINAVAAQPQAGAPQAGGERPA